MTVFKSTDGIVVGQPISPFFGAQNGVQGAGAPTIPVPATTQGTGVQNPILEAAARGALPRNALISTVNTVSTGAQNATPVDDLLGNGAGTQLNLGVAVPGSAGNPVTGNVNGAINQQVFVDGITTANAALATGPVPSNVETLTSAPVSGATSTNALGLASGGFQG
jgi:hypothetical protein